MLLQYFVTENKTGACIPVEITPAHSQTFW